MEKRDIRNEEESKRGWHKVRGDEVSNRRWKTIGRWEGWIEEKVRKE